MANFPKLQIIDGGKSAGVRIGTVRVTCGDSKTSPLFTADAQVTEEDTWQVLSADPEIREEHDHPIRLMTGLIDQQPLTVGDIVIKNREWRAVIYDFDQEPMCRREWVETALHQVLDHVQDKKLGTIAMPLLGCVHDCIEWSESLELLIGLLLSTAPKSLQRIWLEVPDAHLIAVQRQLHAAAGSP